MDVKLPNGHIIRGVPEGTPKHKIAMTAIQAGLATNKDFGYEEGPSAASESGLQNFRAGVGAGMVNVGRRATNLLLPDAITPEWASDETIAEQKRLDEDLEETGAGMAGKLTGEIAATLPLGGYAGRGVAAASRLARPTSSAGKYLVNTLGRGAGRGVVEGATVGATLADPGERTAGGMVGGAFGGALGGVGTALGKALGKGSLVKITEEAKQLQDMTGTFIPLSQSAEAGLGKQFYNAFLANFPGLGGKVRGQYKNAVDDLRRFIGEHAHPPRANIVIEPTDDVLTMMAKLDDYWDTAFDTIKPWPIRVFRDTDVAMPRTVARVLKTHIDEGLVRVPQRGRDLTGDDILKLKTALGELMPNDRAARAPFISYQKKLDKLLERNLNPSGRGQGAGAIALADYRAAAEHYPIWKALQKAAKAVDDKAFKPSTLGRMEPLSGQASPAAVAGRLSKEALEDFPSRQGLFQTLAAMGPVAAAGGGFMAGGLGGAALALLGTYGIGRVMLSKGLQRYLSGQTRAQALGKATLNKYSKELQALGMTARDAAVVLGANDGS